MSYKKYDAHTQAKFCNWGNKESDSDWATQHYYSLSVTGGIIVDIGVIISDSEMPVCELRGGASQGMPKGCVLLLAVEFKYQSYE